MRKIILILTLISFNTLVAQKVNTEIHGYSETYDAPEKNKDKLYNKLKEWIALNYNSAKNVIQLDSKEKIIVKGNFSYFSKAFNNEIYFDHTLILSIKENKFKVDLILPEKVVVTEIFGKKIETQIFEEELKNSITYDVLVQRFTNKYKELNANQKNYEKKYKRAINKQKDFWKNRTLVFKTEFSNNLNNKVNSIYTSIQQFVNEKKDDW